MSACRVDWSALRHLLNAVCSVLPCPVHVSRWTLLGEATTEALSGRTSTQESVHGVSFALAMDVGRDLLVVSGDAVSSSRLGCGLERSDFVNLRFPRGCFLAV